MNNLLSVFFYFFPSCSSAARGNRPCQLALFFLRGDRTTDVIFSHMMATSIVQNNCSIVRLKWSLPSYRHTSPSRARWIHFVASSSLCGVRLQQEGRQHLERVEEKGAPATGKPHPGCGERGGRCAQLVVTTCLRGPPMSNLSSKKDNDTSSASKWVAQCDYS